MKEALDELDELEDKEVVKKLRKDDGVELTNGAINDDDVKIEDENFKNEKKELNIIEAKDKKVLDQIVLSK